MATHDRTLIADYGDDNVPEPPEAAPADQLSWLRSEGAPLPYGVVWIESEQAFNFAVHSESAESVTLLFFSAANLINPVFTFRFDFLRNKSGPVWHCRIPATDIRDARYYAYSVSGPVDGALETFDSEKILVDLMPNAFSSRPSSTVRWPPGKDRIRSTPLSVRLPRIAIPSIGKMICYSIMSPTPSSMSCT